MRNWSVTNLMGDAAELRAKLKVEFDRIERKRLCYRCEQLISGEICWVPITVTCPPAGPLQLVVRNDDTPRVWVVVHRDCAPKDWPPGGPFAVSAYWAADPPVQP